MLPVPQPVVQPVAQPDAPSTGWTTDRLKGEVPETTSEVPIFADESEVPETTAENPLELMLNGSPALYAVTK